MDVTLKGNKLTEQVTVCRSEVIEIATDRFAAGYELVAEFVRMTREQYTRIRTWMINTPGHIVDRVAKKQFVERYYGA